MNEAQQAQFEEWVKGPHSSTYIGNLMFACWRAAYAAGSADENEACAKMIEGALFPESFRKTRIYTEFERGGDNYLKQIAVAIRERQEQAKVKP